MKYRVSNVERFRQWEQDEDGDTAELVADICGLGGASPAMRAGTALHLALENAIPGEVERLEVPGYVFTFSKAFELEVTPIRELRASKTYMVDDEPITISGQVDAIDGLRIEDHKSTARFDPDRYLSGYQWRLYLDIFGAWQFRWNIFEMVEVESAQPSEGFELPPAEYEITAQHTLSQFRYPALEADCLALVTRFARFVRQHIEATA